jgi:hypothetical protein
MALNDLLKTIDGEIAKLRAARALLVGGGNGTGVATRKKPGRPRKDAGVSLATAQPQKKRNLSPEGRARIAAAAKRRWAAKRKAAKG